MLEATFSVLRRYPAATLGSSAVVVGVVSLAQLLLVLPLIERLSPVLEAAEDGDTNRLLNEVSAVPWAALALGGLLVGLLSGLLAIVVGQSAVGTPLGLAGAWRRALPRLPRLLAGVLLVVLVAVSVWAATAVLWALAIWLDSALGYVVVGLATVLVSVPLTIYLSVKVSLTTPALALESTAEGAIGPVTALRRSWALVRGAWWRTLGILLLGAILAGALSQVIAIPLGVIVSAVPLTATAAIVAGVVTAGLGQAVAQPISGLVLALVYVDRRIRTENLDSALARAAGVDLPQQYQQPGPQPPQAQ
jgi:hypothetical protein